MSKSKGIAPGSDAVEIGPLSTNDEDSEMGTQLTSAYHDACGAWPRILRFGAMVIMLEEKLRHRGEVSGGRGNKGGLCDWLKRHAPEVAYTTARRFRDVVLSVAEDYQQVVGAKIAKRFSLPELVTASPDELPEPARAKQLELFEYVSGTSQRSWLSRFSTHCPGGDLTPRDEHGKRVSAPRRTKHEMEMERWREDSEIAIKVVRRGVSELLILKSPDSAASWDLLHGLELEEFKLLVYDLYQGILESQKRRAILEKKGARAPSPAIVVGGIAQ